MGSSWEHKLSSPDAGLDYAKLEQRLWAVALTLALLKTRLDFFQGRMEEEGTLETQGSNSIQISITHSPVEVSENPCSHDITRSPLPLVTGGDTEVSPPVTI